MIIVDSAELRQLGS